MPLTSFLAKQFFKVLQKLPLVRIQIFFGSLSDPILNSIKNARDTAGNCRDRVAVASDTDRISNGVLERHRFKESFKSNENGALAADFVLVLRTDVVQGKIHRIIVFVDVLQDGRDAVLRVVAAGGVRAEMEEQGVHIVKERSQKDARKLWLCGSGGKALVKQFSVQAVGGRGDDGVFGRDVDLREEGQEIFPREVDPRIVPRVGGVGAVFHFLVGDQVEKIARFQAKRLLFGLQKALPAEDIVQAERHMVGDEPRLSLLGRLLHPHVAHAQRRRFVLRVNVNAVLDLVCIRPVKNLF